MAMTPRRRGESCGNFLVFGAMHLPLPLYFDQPHFMVIQSFAAAMDCRLLISQGNNSSSCFGLIQMYGLELSVYAGIKYMGRN